MQWYDIFQHPSPLFWLFSSAAFLLVNIQISTVPPWTKSLSCKANLSWIVINLLRQNPENPLSSSAFPLGSFNIRFFTVFMITVMLPSRFQPFNPIFTFTMHSESLLWVTRPKVCGILWGSISHFSGNWWGETRFLTVTPSLSVQMIFY